ncbi:glycosyltransferase [Kiritimatiellota bacterium B12222]|nr:glycosyltransferase [Kiritimatiellota bacterium B12222]
MIAKIPNIIVSILKKELKINRSPQHDKKILVLVVSTAGHGGTEKISILVGNYLALNAYKIHMIFLDASGSYKDLIHPSITIHDLACNPIELNLIHNLRKIKRLGGLLKVIQPDTIFSNGYYCNCLSVIARRKYLPKVRLVIRETNLTVTKCKKKGIRGLLVLQAMKYLYPHASSFIAPTESVVKDFKKILHKNISRVSVIPNFIDTETIDIQAQKEILDEKFTTLQKPVILSAGRLVDQKDYSTALKAIQKFLKDHGGSYVILGEGPLEAQLRQEAKDLRIQDHVHFLGFKNNPYPYIKSSDIFLMSSWVEGFGIVVLESMYLGIPGVFTDFYPAFRTIVKNEVNGIIVPVGDHKALAENMKKLVTNPKLYKTIHKNAKLCSVDFKIQKIMPQYEKAIFEKA